MQFLCLANYVALYEIVKTGLAEPHHILPETGWVSFYLREESDVQKVLTLLRRSYEIAVKQRQRR